MRARTFFIVLSFVALMAGITQVKSASADYQQQVVASDGLHLRSGPSTDDDVILTIPDGGIVDVLNDNAGWYEVEYDGEDGYVDATWLSDPGVGSDGTCIFVWGEWACASQHLVEMIYAAADYYGADGDQMLNVAACESEFNPDNVGPFGELGVFQFLPGTFVDTEGVDVAYADTQTQVYFAAKLFAQGKSWYWTCNSLMGY